MHDILKDKKVIFFDVGFTLDYPASGDWLFTNKFNEIVGERLKCKSEAEINAARDAGMAYLSANHLVTNEMAEFANFRSYYELISGLLDLRLSAEELDIIAEDKARNMDSYIAYPTPFRS